MITFSELLNGVLKEGQITQKELADRTGIAQPNICRYCKDMEPSLKNFYKICKALDLYIPEVLYYLYGGDEK